MEKIKNICIISIMAVFLSGMSLWCWFREADEYSLSERRYLKQFPQITWETVLNGKFMADFEKYTQEQFPERDTFRSIKSGMALFAFGQKENNGLYLKNGYINKTEYPYNADSIEHAANVLNGVYDKYLAESDCNVYYSIIPDKGYFLAEQNGYLSMDYEQLEADFVAGMSKNPEEGLNVSNHRMTYIDIFDVMNLEDFYYTDTHWRQEEIQDVAGVLAKGMGSELDAEYELCKLEQPFYGVYHGQLALPVQGEDLYYLNNEVLDNCYVYDYTNAEEIPVYDMDKAVGKDPYEMYLSGSLSLITIENPEADTDKELIIFRDSFGSSIAPLFVEEYQKVTLVDIRYIYSGMLGNYIEFNNQDVLFLYSTLVLNNSETLK